MACFVVVHSTASRPLSSWWCGHILYERVGDLIMQNSITLTSKLGSFIFDSDVVLSRAKLIRDTITGQYFSQKPGLPKFQTATELDRYLQYYLSKNLFAIDFEIIFAPVVSDDSC